MLVATQGMVKRKSQIGLPRWGPFRSVAVGPPSLYSRAVVFSSRADWDQTPNALARLRAEMLASGESFIDLTESNPTRCGFAYPDDLVLRALSDPACLAYDPDPRGMRGARAAVSRAFAGALDPERIVLTASTSEAYSWLFKLLCEAGDEVLVPRPSYPLFDYLARLESVRLESYPLTYEDRWRLDWDVLAQKVRPRTRAVIVVHPNNPTGSYLDEKEIAGLREVCRAHGLTIISDEVFFGYPLVESARAPSSLFGISDVLTFCLGGLSKMAGLPQMKLAWIAVNGPVAERRKALQRLELIGDTYLSVGTPVQTGVERLLEAGETLRPQILHRVRGNLEFLARSREPEAAWECLRAEGGWSAVLRLPRIVSEQDWAITLLKQDRIYVHPGFFFDFPGEGYLVVSLLPPEGQFCEGVGRLLQRVRVMAG